MVLYWDGSLVQWVKPWPTQCWDFTWMLAAIPAAPLLIHLPANMLGKAAKAHFPGPLYPHRRTRRSSCFLAAAWLCPGLPVHSGSKASDGRCSLCLYFSL